MGRRISSTVIVFTLLLGLGFAPAAAQQPGEGQPPGEGQIMPGGRGMLESNWVYHNTGAFWISPTVFHWMWYDDANQLDDGTLWGARLGYDLNEWFGIEGLGLWGPTSFNPAAGGASVDANFWSFGIGGKFSAPWWGRFVPYFEALAGTTSMTGDDPQGRIEDSDSRFVTILGAGFEYFLCPNFGLRFSAADYLQNSDFIADDEATNNWELGLGLTFLWGGGPDDSDEDGVPDDIDQCPDTPAGVAVDRNGCSQDNDGDGVPDFRDRCPGTPSGTEVDTSGCERQYPDADGDGVRDNLDQELNTPSGARVDRQGRAVDSDGDGVPDGIDQCPDTEKGARIDSRGCPIEAGDAFLGEALFEFNRAVLRPQYQELLRRQVVQALQDDDELKLAVVGYADQVGPERYNLGLGMRRAQAVCDFLTGEGVTGERIYVFSGGEYPVWLAGVDRDERQRRAMVLRWQSQDLQSFDAEGMAEEEQRPEAGEQQGEAGMEGQEGTVTEEQMEQERQQKKEQPEQP